MAKYDQLYAGCDGWSPWRWPVGKGYRFACCDCGLVHDVEVAVHETRGGRVRVEPSDRHVIRWRFRVNGRATGQVRRQNRVVKSS